MLPPHYYFFEVQRNWINSRPILYLATTGIYYFISLRFLSARVQKIINIVFASYIALLFLSLLFMIAGLFWDSL